MFQFLLVPCFYFFNGPCTIGIDVLRASSEYKREMLWCSLIELDFLYSLLLFIVYGLFSLRSKSLNLNDVYFFCRLFPLFFVMGNYIEGCSYEGSILTLPNPSIDLLVALLTYIIMANFRSFESVLLLLFAFIGNYFIIHSVDLLTFFIALEAQNFCFLVLCGLQTSKYAPSFSVEAALKYFVYSAFSSGVILFWFSAIYLQTGLSVLSFNTLLNDDSFFCFQILCAMMFKLGAAPLHLWVSQIYSGVKRNLLMYISTAPKLSLFGFWVSSFHYIWSSYSVLLFCLFSIILGSFSAYSQPALRNLFAYSTINEIGIMLLAIETAGFHSLFLHFGLYMISQILLWNLSDKRLFSIIAVSLAGLPPLAGFFGKFALFWWAGVSGTLFTLLAALFCTCISLVYYLRIIRLFWHSSTCTSIRVIHNDILPRKGLTRLNLMLGYADVNNNVLLTSTCVILLVFTPFFVIKPFVYV